MHADPTAPIPATTFPALHAGHCYASSCGRVTLYLGDWRTMEITGDILVTDPPYGDVEWGTGKAWQGKCGTGRLWDGKPEWDVKPTPEEIARLLAMAPQAIIWGGNYFDLPPTRCILCWDKEQPWENFSQWEMAWTSFDKPAALFKRQNGGQEPGKIHPTQKPLRLYNWLLSRFAEPGWKILDTHMGSGSIAIACHYARLHLTASEIDPGYFAAACARIERETAQESFDFPNDLAHTRAGTKNSNEATDTQNENKH